MEEKKQSEKKGKEKVNDRNVRKRSKEKTKRGCEWKAKTERDERKRMNEEKME